jgi:hypothetical protein
MLKIIKFWRYYKTFYYKSILSLSSPSPPPFAYHLSSFYQPPRNFTLMWLCIVMNPYNKTNQTTNFSNLFWNETLSSRIRMELVPSWSCSKAVYKPVRHISLLHVQWKTPDDGQRNCPKHVEFHSKINLRN